MDTVGVLLRRWLLLGVGLALTGYAGWWVLGHVGSDHQATGQLVFLLPPDSGGVTPINPYLNLQGGLSTAASLVSSHVMTQDTQQRLAAEGHTAEYDLALSPETGPLVVVTAKDKDPAVAEATRDAVMVEVGEVLAELQRDKGIPSRQVITSQPSNAAAPAEVLPGSRLRALVGTLSAGLVLLLVATFALDRARLRRLRGPRSTEVVPVDRARSARGTGQPGLARPERTLAGRP